MNIAPHNSRIYARLNALHGIQPYSPIDILYFAGVTGSFAASASLFSAVYISQVLLEVPTGVLSDFVGRVRTVTLGTICNALSIGLYLIGGSYWTLLAGATFQGAMQAFFSGNNQALLYESCLQDGDETYHSHMARAERNFHIAATVSAVFGGVLALVSFRFVYATALLPAVCAIAASTRLVEPAAQQRNDATPRAHLSAAIRHLRSNSRLRTITAASSIEYAVGHASFSLQQAFNSTLWPVWALGMSRALSGLFASISFAMSSRIIDRFGPLKTLIYLGVWGKVLPLIGLLRPSVASPFMASTASLTFGTGIVANSTLMQQEFTSEQRATLGSITSVIGSVLAAVASVALGLLADQFGLRVALLCGLGSLSIATLLYVRLHNVAS